MQADVTLSFRLPREGRESDVVGLVVFGIRFLDGELAGLELELHGTRIRKAAGGRLFMTWPARPTQRADQRRYWDYVRGGNEAEARKRLIRAFENWRRPG